MGGSNQKQTNKPPIYVREPTPLINDNGTKKIENMVSDNYYNIKSLEILKRYFTKISIIDIKPIILYDNSITENLCCYNNNTETKYTYMLPIPVGIEKNAINFIKNLKNGNKSQHTDILLYYLMTQLVKTQFFLKILI